ncbi:MAG TPA: ATP-binding protein [Nevskiaceae bacterium]
MAVDWKASTRRQFRRLVDFLRPPAPGDVALPLGAAREIAERMRLSEVLPYRGIEDDGLFLTESGTPDRPKLRLGFTLRYQPFSRVGTDSEVQVEGLIAAIKTTGAVIQFGVLSSATAKPIFDAWALARRPDPTRDDPVAIMAEARRKFMLAASHKYSLLSGWGYHPKDHLYVMTVTLPYTGELHDEPEWKTFVAEVRRTRATLVGTFKGMQLGVMPMNGGEFRSLLQVLLNPHVPAEVIDRDRVLMAKGHDVLPGVDTLMERDTRLIVRNDGLLNFKRNDDDPGKYVAMLTVDGYPQATHLPQTAWLTTGEPLSPREHINLPFWAWLNIAVQNTDKANDRMSVKAAGIARQLISDSPSYRALMSHLVEQQDDVQSIRDAIRAGASLVYGSMGVNIIGSDPETLGQTLSETASAWKRHGFRASPERFIHLPVYLASLPGSFTQDMDPVERRGGLQRGSSMTTRHAALLAPMQGEWKGTPPSGGGLLLLSRRGQPAVFNVQDKKAGANYNFVIVARTGSGKSFVAQELIMDFLAKGGYAFVIDAGRSYYEMCELLGGVNLVFKMDDPLDLNPFATITTEDRLKEQTEMLVELVRYMAFPETVKAQEAIDDWQNSAVEKAIEAVWNEHREHTTLPMVAEWLGQQDDPRAKDLADQLRAYTHGRFAPWFDGKGKKVDLSNHFSVVEMDDLKGQGMFRNVVLTMVMQRIAETMYGMGDPNIPKLMMIDEAWDLLGNMQSGAFIERAYRTYRKYGGSAGIITQGFNDLTKSQAAMAAYANSSWLFALAQKAESLDAAFKDGLLNADDALREQLKSVHTAPGDYSEIFVRGDNGQGIYRFIVDPYAYWLFTSAPQDKAQRNAALGAVEKEHPDWSHAQQLSEAVKRLADAQTRKRYGQSADEALAELGMLAEAGALHGEDLK